MVFSSVQFLFLFLPLCLTAYYLCRFCSRFATNIVLAVFSCLFYAYGERVFFVVMIAVLGADWLLALLISVIKTRKIARFLLFISLLINFSILFIYKYLDFSIIQLNALFDLQVPLRHISLPIGISFFTFQAASYVIDVYKGNGKAQKNPIYVLEYIMLFPQLIAGPIVRYRDISSELFSRKETWDDFSEGCHRFILGFAKKTVLANSFAMMADMTFQTIIDNTELSVVAAWLGAIGYSLQIYYDFSGYSDMAIGLGMMFGFHFKENFNYPYASRSISEFWRRWHISLGSWFRDYVYIPLGGNRGGQFRLFCNLFAVWLLTGIWHGANWTFIVWGLWYFTLISLEKVLDSKKINYRGSIGHIITLFLVMLGWIVFRAPSLNIAIRYILALVPTQGHCTLDELGLLLLSEYGMTMILGAVFSVPIIPTIKRQLKEKNNAILPYISVIISLGLFLLSLSYIVKGSYNPFIYFNF